MARIRKGNPSFYSTAFTFLSIKDYILLLRFIECGKLHNLPTAFLVKWSPKYPLTSSSHE